MSKIKWCVCSGPDESHLLDVAWFARLKDAKEYTKNMPERPTGGSRPFKIEKHVFRSNYE